MSPGKLDLSSHVHMCLAGHTAKPKKRGKAGKMQAGEKESKKYGRQVPPDGRSAVFIYLLDETRQAEGRNRICKDSLRKIAGRKTGQKKEEPPGMARRPESDDG